MFVTFLIIVTYLMTAVVVVAAGLLAHSLFIAEPREMRELEQIPLQALRHQKQMNNWSKTVR